MVLKLQFYDYILVSKWLCIKVYMQEGCLKPNKSNGKPQAEQTQTKNHNKSCLVWICLSQFFTKPHGSVLFVDFVLSPEPNRTTNSLTQELQINEIYTPKKKTNLYTKNKILRLKSTKFIYQKKISKFFLQELQIKFKKLYGDLNIFI